MVAPGTGPKVKYPEKHSRVGDRISGLAIDPDASGSATKPEPIEMPSRYSESLFMQVCSKVCLLLQQRYVFSIVASCGMV